jgi:hypothetical protein
LPREKRAAPQSRRRPIERDTRRSRNCA